MIHQTNDTNRRGKGVYKVVAGDSSIIYARSCIIEIPRHWVVIKWLAIVNEIGQEKLPCPVLQSF